MNSSGNSNDNGNGDDWGRLPPDVLRKIIEKLLPYVTDIARLCSVCSSWLSAVADFNNIHSSQLPWLMLPYPVSPFDHNTRQFFCLSSSSSVYSPPISSPPPTSPSSNYYYSFPPFPFHSSPPSPSSLANNTYRSLNLPELQGKVYHGLNHGSWLLVINSGCEASPILFNPFSRSRIPLPPLPLPTIWEHCERGLGSSHTHIAPVNTIGYDNNKFLGTGFHTTPVSYAVISIDHSVSMQEFEVMVIHGWDKQIAFCRPGDVAWTTVADDFELPWRKINCLGYSNGLFYAIHDNKNLLLCDIQASPAKATVTSPLPAGPLRSYMSYMLSEERECYLIGLDQELLLVMRGWIGRKTKKFRVFKLVEDKEEEENEEEEVEVEDGEEDGLFFNRLNIMEVENQDGKWLRMDTIGDRAIFICKENSFVISTMGLVNCSPSCIYAFDVYKEKVDFSETSIKLIEYCMEDNKRKKMINCSPASSLWLWQPLWLQPSVHLKRDLI